MGHPRRRRGPGHAPHRRRVGRPGGGLRPGGAARIQRPPARAPPVGRGRRRAHRHRQGPARPDGPNPDRDHPSAHGRRRVRSRLLQYPPVQRHHQHRVRQFADPPPHQGGRGVTIGRGRFLHPDPATPLPPAPLFGQSHRLPGRHCHPGGRGGSRPDLPSDNPPSHGPGIVEPPPPPITSSAGPCSPMCGPHRHHRPVPMAARRSMPTRSPSIGIWPRIPYSAR